MQSINLCLFYCTNGPDLKIPSFEMMPEMIHGKSLKSAFGGATFKTDSYFINVIFGRFNLQL